MRNWKESELFQNQDYISQISSDQLKNAIKDVPKNKDNVQQKQLQNLPIFQTNKTIFNQKLPLNDKTKHQEWRQSQIKKIFRLYAQYGSQWKIIQTQFPGKSSNSIKNRFYTVVRTFLKVLFRQHPSIQNKLPHQIASKIILKFYQGRQQFVKFKGFGKKIMKNINYDVQSKLLPKLVLENAEQILILYNLVFPQVINEKPKKKKSKGQVINPVIASYQRQGNLQNQNKLLLLKTDTSYQPVLNSTENIPDFGHNQMYQIGIGFQGQNYQPNYFVFPSLGFCSIVNYPFFEGI